MTTQKYNIIGMHCASCASIIKKKLTELPGITSIEVNFATEKAEMVYDPKLTSLTQINHELNKYGYQFVLNEDGKTIYHHKEATEVEIKSKPEVKSKDHIKPFSLNSLKRKLNFFMPVALYIFLWMIWHSATQLLTFLPHFPLSMRTMNYLLFGIASLTLYFLGKPYLVAIKKFWQYRVANMDTLVGLGTSIAYIYSAAMLFLPINGLLNSRNNMLYFDATIIVLSFVTYGNYLTALSRKKTSESLEALINLQVKNAVIKRNGKELQVPYAEIELGDIMVVKAGQKIPTDGIIVSGYTAVDESMITGESMPIEKKVNDQVIGSTLSTYGTIEVKATKLGEQTVLAHIIQLVENAQNSKAPLQNLADKVAAVFVPTVLIIALLVFVGWLVIGSQYYPLSEAFAVGLNALVGILVIACPCAMGLATPSAVITTIGKAAENGILIKNAEILEKFPHITHLLFDKTGTLTLGKPQVVDIVAIKENLSPQQLLAIASSLEKYSDHPLAQAVIEAATTQNINNYAASDTITDAGLGINGIIDQQRYFVGNRKYVQSNPSITPFNYEDSSLHTQTAVFVASQTEILGYITFADQIKSNAMQVVHQLNQQGIQTQITSGDTETSVKNIASQTGITRYSFEALPQDKLSEISRLQKLGYKVAMVGDGINDSPSLAQADVGIAMGNGTDVAMETADVVLLGDDLNKLPQTVALTRHGVKTIKQNLFWAFIYNIVGIPLAAGILYPTYKMLLDPSIAGAAMALSSVSVVLNSLRLKKLSFKSMNSK